MTDAAFRYEHSRADANAPGGKLKTFYVARAATQEEAFPLVAKLAPDATGLRLVGIGPEVLKEAIRRGIAVGQATVI